MRRFLRIAAGLAFAVPAAIAAQHGSARFLRFAEVQEVLAAFADSGLPAGAIPDASTWDRWVRDHDREVRRRIDRGVEDSISNLILFGTSYTGLPRLESVEQAASEGGELVEAARARAHALAVALAHPQGNERLRFASDFLGRWGDGGPPVEELLLANLRRFVSEQRAYQEKLRAAGRSGDPGEVLFTRGTLYQGRGLSVDTSLLPNYALEDTLRALVAKKVLAPGSVRRVAVIGPGLDFADKREGHDYYPLQTIQPFALLEAVLRLRLGETGRVQVAAFDLNPAVNAHLRRMAEQARAGRACIIQLPRDASAEWAPQAVSYWDHFGEIIGSPVRALAPPPGLKGLVTRAVAIQPRYAASVDAADLDIVAQTVETPPGASFDLVVATNVLVYYDRLEQALAMASIAQMMSSGGVFLANHVLPAQHPVQLQYLGRRSISYSARGAYGDDVVVYRRR